MRTTDQKADLDQRAREQAEILRRIEDKRKADEAARIPPLRIPPAWNPTATNDPKQRLAEINQKEAGWRSSLRNYHTLSLKNDCMDGSVAVAIRYLLPEGAEQWVTQGWFVVPAGKTLDTGAVSRDGRFYVFGQGAGHTWSGDNKDGSVKLWVISTAFAFIPGDKPPDAGKRVVSFFLRGFTSPGVHSQRFVCAAK